MATQKSVQWTVLVVVEDDVSLNKNYQISSNTSLFELREMWKDDCRLFGHWVFKSVTEEIIYDDDWMTLEMIGSSVPLSRILNLKAELSDIPTPRLISEIFVYTNDKCHRLFVKPYERLYEVLGHFPGRPKRFEFNGSPLNVKHTVKQAGLQDKSIIFESLCSVTVKMSSGYSKVFQLPSDSLVCHLKEKVNSYEIFDFSLKYKERCLQLDESVRQLTQIVEVATAEFVVHLNDRRVSWMAADKPIAITEFISQLSAEADIEAKTLENMQFVCVGCQRQIFNSEDFIQKLPMECCKERSLTLKTLSHSNSGMGLETSDASKLTQCLNDQLVQCRTKDLRSEGSRCVFRELKKRCEAEGLSYNTVTQCSQSLLRSINELEDKIKALQVVIETLRDKKDESEAEIERLRTTNIKGMEEIERLRRENRKLSDENKNLKMKDPQGATAAGPPRPPTAPDEQLGVKLLVIYHPDHFSPASLPEVQQGGKLPWDASSSFIKCRVASIRAGWASFEELRDVQQRLLPGRDVLKRLLPGNRRLISRRKIQGIGQFLGAVAGKEVAQTTSREEDEVPEPSQSPFCDVDGAEHSWEEAEPEWQVIGPGGRVLICGGGRRTVLVISA